MSITTYITGWLTKKTLSTALWIGIPLFLVVQCGRGCGSAPQPVSSTFDYTAIATSFHRVDTIPVDTQSATEDLKEILPSEMIEFAKDHSSLFAKYLSSKYRISNGYVEKIERSNLDSRISNSDLLKELIQQSKLKLMGLENLFNSVIPMSALFGFIIILVIAMRSKSDGKALIETFKKKRFLGIEISQGALALSEGMMAAAISVELFALPYGVRLTGHVALILVSVFSGFQIGDQIKEAKNAIETGVDVVAECADAFMSVLLSILPPFANVAYIATSLKGYRDIVYFFTFQHDRIKSGMIMITCWIFIIHVLVVIYLATASTRKEKDEPGGVTDPLVQASDDDSEDANIDDDKPEIITNLPVPVSFDPTKVDVENYLCENFTVDRQRLHHRLAVNPVFKRDIGNLVTEALTYREEWENHKAELAELTRNLEANERKKTLSEKSYNFDPEKVTYRHLLKDIKEQKELAKHGKNQVDESENNYNAVLDEINSELGSL